MPPPKMEEYKRPSDSDISYMVRELYSNWKSDSIAVTDWEGGFIYSMNNKLNFGEGFTESMEQKIKQIFEKHLSYGPHDETPRQY